MSNETLNFLKEITKYILYYPRLFLVGFTFALLSSLLTGLGAWSIKPIFNYVFLEKHYEFFKVVPLYLLLIFTLIGLFSLLQAYYMKSFTLRVVNRIRLELFNKCLSLPYYKLSAETSGQTVSKVINDTSQIEPLLGESSQIIFKEGLTVLVLIGVALSQRWDLTLLALVTLPVIIFGTKHLGSKTRKARRRTQASTGELTHRMSEILQGIREIKLSPSRDLIVNFFSKELERFYKLSLKVTKYRESSKSLVDLMTGVGGALLLSYGGILVIKGALSPGAFFSVITAILLIFNPIRKLSRAYTGLKEAQGAFSRIEEVFKLEEERSGTLVAFPPKKGITFKEVSFRFFNHGSYILQRVSLFIPVNHMIALVGPSGAGKSTLISLLPRFYDPQEGEILLDDINIKEFDLTSLRNLYGLVWQEPFFFNLSIWENLILVKPEATYEEVISACKMAQALDFILELPQSFNTILGEEGFTLSGGQKQRLALARVFLKRPPIIVLDEATSQLDALTEKAIETALHSLKGKHTLIVVAHRLSTILRADKIVVLNRGEIIAEGKHADLLERSPLYRELYQSFTR